MQKLLSFNHKFICSILLFIIGGMSSVVFAAQTCFCRLSYNKFDGDHGVSYFRQFMRGTVSGTYKGVKCRERCQGDISPTGPINIINTCKSIASGNAARFEAVCAGAGESIIGTVKDYGVPFNVPNYFVGLYSNPSPGIIGGAVNGIQTNNISNYCGYVQCQLKCDQPGCSILSNLATSVRDRMKSIEDNQSLELEQLYVNLDELMEHLNAGPRNCYKLKSEPGTTNQGELNPNEITSLSSFFNHYELCSNKAKPAFLKLSNTP
jgi:hypothetical protein